MTNISEIYFSYIKGRRVTTDSRDIQKGDVFIALKGENFNGNGYAAQALEKGAGFAVIDEEKYADGVHHEV